MEFGIVKYPGQRKSGRDILVRAISEIEQDDFLRDLELYGIDAVRKNLKPPSRDLFTALVERMREGSDSI